MGGRGPSQAESHRGECPHAAPRLKPAFSDTEREQQLGPHADRPRVALSQGLLPGQCLPSPRAPGCGVLGSEREGEGAVTQEREMTETFLLQGHGEGGTPQVSAAINHGP